MVVLAPSSVQEAADLVAEGFDIADQYRTPVMILGDGMIGQMMEPVEFKEHQSRKLPEKTWAANGWRDKSRPRNIVNSLYIEAEAMEEVNRQLQAKYAEITKNETRVQEIMCEDADYIIAAFGTTARIAKNAALKAREMGVKVGVIRPITLWPFPTETFAKAAERVKGMLCVEMNTGQMIEDVRLSVSGKVPVEFYGTTGGFVPTPDAVVEALMKLKEGR